jgi:hypothetical protein
MCLELLKDPSLDLLPRHLEDRVDLEQLLPIVEQAALVLLQTIQALQADLGLPHLQRLLDLEVLAEPPLEILEVDLVLAPSSLRLEIRTNPLHQLLRSIVVN